MKKQFIGKHLWELLAITLAILVAISFAFGGNWGAFVWALLTGSYAGLFLRERLTVERLEKKYIEALTKREEK